MSKKDFIALANALRGTDVSEDVLRALCQFCRQQNHRFNERLWRDYLTGKCGPNGGKLDNPNAR